MDQGCKVGCRPILITQFSSIHLNHLRSALRSASCDSNFSIHWSVEDAWQAATKAGSDPRRPPEGEKLHRAGQDPKTCDTVDTFDILWHLWHWSNIHVLFCKCFHVFHVPYFPSFSRTTTFFLVKHLDIFWTCAERILKKAINVY